MKKVILIIVLLAGCFWIYRVPFASYMAKNSFYTYLEMNRIDRSEVVSLDMKKTYLNSGYRVCVVYKDAPELRYEYQYETDDWDEIKPEFAVVYTADEGVLASTDLYRHLKYPVPFDD